MSHTSRTAFYGCAFFACAMALSAMASPARAEDTDLARGQYLVNLLGCGRWHTEGYLTGDEATGAFLAGSQLGIAYTAYSEDESNPGIVFPSNLTGDDETGLGKWSEEEVAQAITTGIVKGPGHERLIVMPWPNYNALTRSDLQAIARFLKALPAVANPIPEAIPEGAPIDRPYVRFGAYEFHPHRRAEPAP